MIPVMNSWKYAGPCASLKGTLTYLYLPKGDLNAVFDIQNLSKAIQGYPAHRSSVEKYLAPFHLEKIPSTLGIGQVNFLVTWLNAW